MKLPRFLAESMFSDPQEFELDFDSYEFAYEVDSYTVKLHGFNNQLVAIQDVANQSVYWFQKPLDDMYDYMHEDLIEYTLNGYCEGQFFEFNEETHQYSEIKPFKYFNEAADKYIDAGRDDFLYVTDGFEDLNLLIPDCAEDRATNLETIEGVTEFMQSLGYERVSR